MRRPAQFVTIVPLLGLAVLVYVFAHPPWTAARFAGLALMLLGFPLLTLARIQLGDSFSVTPQARQLVTRGLYSRIRNPVYVFGLLGLLGVVLYVDISMLLLLPFLFIVPMQIYRARAESRVLEERFGDQYRQYKAKTWF
jgi:protein-S-isoprenylcysteine O-methyltransferase Ste14